MIWLIFFIFLHDRRLFAFQAVDIHPFQGLLNAKLISSNVSLRAFFEIYEQFAEPDNNIWSFCRNCHYTNQSFFIPSESAENQRVLLSRSIWEEFFYEFHNDQYFADVVSPESLWRSNHTIYYIDTPVYILPMITFHHGHILIDLLEPLFSTRAAFSDSFYNDDILLVIDVASEKERMVLTKYIEDMTSSKTQLGSVIASLSQRLITANDFFTLLAKHHLVFRFIHFGLSTLHSSYYNGYRFHPQSFKSIQNTSYFRFLQSQFEEFSSFQERFIEKEYLLSESMTTITPEGASLNHPSRIAAEMKAEETVEVDVLVITRSNSRVIENLDQLLHLLSRLALTYKLADLAQVEFQEQLFLFTHSRVIVAAAGTAVHNVLWSRQAAWIVLMPPLWCDWSWLYSNAIALKGRKVAVVCSEHSKHPNEQEERFFQWSRKSWSQLPRLSRSMNFTVAPRDFLRALQEVLNLSESESDLSSVFPSPSSSSFPRDALSERKVVKSLTSFRSFLSPVTVQRNTAASSVSQDTYRLIFEGNTLSGPVSSLVASFFRSSPAVSVCYREIVLGEATTARPWCVPLRQFNYYSTLQATVTSEASILQFWLQAFPTGGKLAGSDLFWAIDCQRYPQDCGVFVAKTIMNPLLDDPATDWSPCLKQQQQLQMEKKKKKEEEMTETLSESCVKLLYERLFHYMALQEAVLGGPLLTITSATRATRAGLLPLRQDYPRPTQPFIFLHFDKSGGTSLREMISTSAESFSSTHSYRFEAIIPCHRNLSCLTFHLEPSLLEDHSNRSNSNKRWREVAIVAGHFSWEVWKRLPLCSSLSLLCRPSVLVIGRHPVDRVISYYYQRLYQESTSPFYQRPLNTIDEEDWRELLLQYRLARVSEDRLRIVVVDEGMSEAICRTILDQRTTTGLVNPSGPLPLPPVLSEGDILRAIDHLRLSVVGLTERWPETLEMIRYWFPWIQTKEEVHLNAYPSIPKEKKESLRSDLYRAIVEANPCDLRLYEEMVALFEKQLALLRRQRQSG